MIAAGPPKEPSLAGYPVAVSVAVAAALAIGIVGLWLWLGPSDESQLSE